MIVDDGDDAIGDLVNAIPGVRYIRLNQRLSIGAKRNLACREARGELIAQWDDDDWYAPDRLSYQARPILDDQADLTGLENTYLLELPAGRFWTTQHQLHQRMFVGDVHGGTLVFRKNLLNNGLRYPEVNLAEDAGLLKQASAARQTSGTFAQSRRVRVRAARPERVAIRARQVPRSARLAQYRSTQACLRRR